MRLLISSLSSLQCDYKKFRDIAIITEGEKRQCKMTGVPKLILDVSHGFEFLELLASPVPTQTMFGSDGATATSPMEKTFS
jgi:CRISPR-associated DxTHG motif protein